MTSFFWLFGMDFLHIGAEMKTVNQHTYLSYIVLEKSASGKKTNVHKNYKPDLSNINKARELKSGM